MARAKGGKNKYRSTSTRPDAHGGEAAATMTGHKALNPPTKKPTLLATSVVLFGVWFVYLLVVALSG